MNNPLTSLLLISIFSLSMASSAASAMVDGETYGDWRAECLKPTTGKKQQPSCHVFQNLLGKESGKRVLHMAIGPIPGKKTLALIITTPLGILLPAGLTLRIDGKDPKRIPMQACFQKGCQAIFPLQSAWQKKLMGGNKAEVIFYNIQNKPISIQISLKGITAAVTALQANK